MGNVVSALVWILVLLYLSSRVPNTLCITRAWTAEDGNKKSSAMFGIELGTGIAHAVFRPRYGTVIHLCLKWLLIPYVLEFHL